MPGFRGWSGNVGVCLVS